MLHTGNGAGLGGEGIRAGEHVPPGEPAYRLRTRPSYGSSGTVAGMTSESRPSGWSWSAEGHQQTRKRGREREEGRFSSLQRLAFPFCLSDFPSGLVLMKLFSLPFFDPLNFLLNWGRCVHSSGELEKSGRTACSVSGGSWPSPESLVTQRQRVTVNRWSPKPGGDCRGGEEREPTGVEM